MPTETIIRTLKESKADNPKHILPRTALKAVADESGNYISSDVTAQDINNLHGKTFVTAEQQTLTTSQKEQVRQDINAAAPDGYYGESGGVFQYSTNFLGKNAPSDEKNIVFRPTASQMSGHAWTAHSISGQTATIEKIKGRTVVFNQLVQNGNFAASGLWSGGHCTLSIANGKCTATATQAADYDLFAIRQDNVGLSIPNGHKIFCTADVQASNTASEMYFQIRKDTSGWAYVTSSHTSVSAADAKLEKIIDNNSGFALIDIAVVLNNSRVGDTAILSNFMCFDLTQMFGAGNEPQTVEEFKAQFPLDYYDYNPGELVSLNATGLKTVGFNQLYSDGHIDVLKGLTYKIEGAYTSLKDSAGNDVTVTNGEFTPTSNDTYTMVGGSCVHLKWSGARDGETEEHWNSTLSLPIATYFPDGMKSAGTAYDELTKGKAVKRIGKVDLGALNWRRELQGDIYRFDSIERLDAEIPLTLYDLPHAISAHYTVANYLNFINADKSLTIIWADSTAAGKVFLRNDSYTDAAAFKAAMSGVYLYYELAEPVETPIDPPLNLTYRCDDFGTEMLLPQNDDEPVTAPMDADIVYQLDYEANVRNMPVNTISKESMDAFIAAFNASGLGTITQTWDAANGRYAYTVAPPTPPTE